MITSPSFFDSYKSQISHLLFNESQPVHVIVIKTENMDYHNKTYYEEKYQSNFIEQPISTRYASKEIIFHTRVQLFFERYYDLDSLDRRETDENIKEGVKACEPGDGLMISIQEMIDEKFHNLYHRFGQVVQLLKASPEFVEIEDTVLVIKNLINHYSAILADANTQLDCFWGLTLTKPIADIIATAYLDFFKSKLSMYQVDEAKQSMTVNFQNTDNFKIKWLGGQVDLVELMVELQRKGWINRLDEISLRKSAELLDRCFDLSASQIRARSKVADNIYTLLKGEYNERKERQYKFDKSGYNKNFDTIKILGFGK